LKDFHRVGKSIIDNSTYTTSRNNQAFSNPYNNNRGFLNSQQNPSINTSDIVYNKDRLTPYGKDYRVSPGLE